MRNFNLTVSKNSSNNAMNFAFKLCFLIELMPKQKIYTQREANLSSHNLTWGFWRSTHGSWVRRHRWYSRYSSKKLVKVGICLFVMFIFYSYFLNFILLFMLILTTLIKRRSSRGKVFFTPVKIPTYFVVHYKKEAENPCSQSSEKGLASF